MPNDVKLQEGHPVDENLRPIKVGDKATAIETAQHGNGARVNGDLEVTGEIRGRNVNGLVLSTETNGATTIETIDEDGANADLTIKADGDLNLQGNAYTYIGSYIEFDQNGSGAAGASMKLMSILDTGDYFMIDTTTLGATTITTVDDGGEGADLTLNIDGYVDINSASGENITLDSGGDIDISSNDGNFIMRKGTTEFSASNSSYAGMLLGCTHVFGSGTGGVFVSISNTWANLVWDTDKYALVPFKVPPSKSLKISLHLPYIAAAGIELRLGLATDSSATTLNTKYENDVDDANRPDSFNTNYSWVVEGSDHSWAAGESKVLYIMAYAASLMRLYTGGTNTSGYGGVIVEAIALPATIGDGSEP